MEMTQLSQKYLSTISRISAFSVFSMFGWRVIASFEVVNKIAKLGDAIAISNLKLSITAVIDSQCTDPLTH